MLLADEYPTKIDKLSYSIDEAVVATSLGRTNIFNLIRDGKLRAVRVGNRTIIPADVLKAFVNGTLVIPSETIAP